MSKSVRRLEESKSVRRPEDDASVVELIPALRAFARSLCKNPYDADDLVQETLVKALNSFHQYEPGTRLKSWLFTIMRNAFYTRAKSYNRESPSSFDFVEHQLIGEASQECAVRMREVSEALGTLPVNQREILMLIALAGSSYEEAAEISGCAVGTVKSRLSRARMGIARSLGETSTSSARHMKAT